MSSSIEWTPDRDDLGRRVRAAWIKWALTQPSPKPSWLVPYDELPETDKEADRQIGEALVEPFAELGEGLEKWGDENFQRAFAATELLRRVVTVLDAEVFDELAADTLLKDTVVFLYAREGAT